MNVCVFLYFFLTMEIYFSHVLEILWIHRKNLSRSMNGKDMDIPIYFPWTGKNIPKFLQKPTDWEWYGLPQNISMFWEFVHSQTLGIKWVFINSKSARYSRTGELPVFSYTCSIIWEFTYGLGIVWISASREICKKTHNFGVFVFSQTFPLT